MRGLDSWLTREPDDESNYPEENDVTETNSKLAEALCKAQSQIKGAVKDATNPHFQNRYADLASVWEACRKPLTDNGLSIIQYTQIDTAENGGYILVTRLMHSSGESIQGVTPLIMGKNDMQALGSAITYARRYGLAAMVGVAPEDDDGNAAVAEGPKRVEKPKPAKEPEGFAAWLALLKTAAVAGGNSLKQTFKDGTKAQRDYLTSTAPDVVKQLKALADEADAVMQNEAVSGEDDR